MLRRSSISPRSTVGCAVLASAVLASAVLASAVLAVACGSDTGAPVLLDGVGASGPPGPGNALPAAELPTSPASSVPPTSGTAPVATSTPAPPATDNGTTGIGTVPTPTNDPATTGAGGSPNTPVVGDGSMAGASNTPPPVAAPVIAAGVRWVGRADLTDPGAPRFAWSGSGFVATAAGTQLAVDLTTENTSEPIFFQPVVDGTVMPRFSVLAGSQTATLATGLADGSHTVELYRETEGQYGDSVFLGFSQGTLQDPPASPGRLIEFIGDSISAGFGNLGVEQHPNFGPDPNGGCDYSTETQSAYQAYPAIAARALDAEASIVALSGWGVFRDNQNDPSRVLPNVYANAVGTQATPAWSFAAAPQAVVINLGTNDFALGDPGADAFIGAYTQLLSTVRSRYPDAFIFCAVGSLLFGTGLTTALDYHQTIVANANQSGDPRVVMLDLGEQNASLGTGCAFHPNVTEQTRLAGLLEAAIRTNLGW